ncbi:right-handed parallel beta-helix repeat-containing protein [bacterium]|nr:right-handed parallel beta-helix repeat-containing protein [bacterium]
MRNRLAVPSALITLLLPIVAASAAPATVFYVREIGSDDNDGLSPTAAFRTIKRGAAAVFNHGDRVVVGPGVYEEGNIDLARNGIAGRPIAIVADASGVETGDSPGEVLIRPGQETAAFGIMGRQHIVIDGFTVEGAFDAAVRVRPRLPGGSDPGASSADITIRNMEVRGGAKRGFDVVASGPVLVIGNRLIANGSTGIAVQGCVESSSSQRCRGEAGGVAIPFISGNVIAMSGAHGVYIEDAVAPIVQHNIVVSSGGTGILVRSAPDPLLANNLIYDSGESGISLGSADAATPNPIVINNTVAFNSGWGMRIGSANAASPGGRVLANIFSGNLGGGITLASGSTDDYVAGFNIVPDGVGDKTPTNPYHFSLDPLFADPAGADGVLGGVGWEDDDFRLQPTSPGIDGTTIPVADLGLTGSATIDGRADVASVDIGFHHGADVDQPLSFIHYAFLQLGGDLGQLDPDTQYAILNRQLDVELPFMPVYVRMTGNNRNHGRMPNRAMRSIKAAARLGKAGVTIVVGPGRYEEGTIFVQQRSGRMSFLGDAWGQLTGDDPGPVLVDAGGQDTGFVIFNAPFAVVDGFHVTNARTAGIQIQRASHHAWVRNNVAFSNLQRGIDVREAHDVRVTNNLAYANGTGGIQISGKRGSGSHRAVVQNNTAYDNGANGFTIGPAGAASPCARVRYNIAQRNAKNGFHLGSAVAPGDSRPGYLAAYNINADGYAANTPRPDSDLRRDPLFAAPAGRDGILGGDGFADDAFQLQHLAADQSADSPAIDFAPPRAVELGLADRTTRTDQVPDAGWLDAGFHYARPDSALEFRNRTLPAQWLQGSSERGRYYHVNPFWDEMDLELPTLCDHLNDDGDGSPIPDNRDYLDYPDEESQPAGGSGSGGGKSGANSASGLACAIAPGPPRAGGPAVAVGAALLAALWRRRRGQPSASTRLP